MIVRAYPPGLSSISRCLGLARDHIRSCPQRALGLLRTLQSVTGSTIGRVQRVLYSAKRLILSDS
jgi:hypothetical protein